MITKYCKWNALVLNNELLTYSDNYASVSGSSSNAFAVLAKIVNHLKVRLIMKYKIAVLYHIFLHAQQIYLKNHHQRGFHHPLDLEEILEETKQYSVSARIKHWLATEVEFLFNTSVH